jgi:hypothetical protein
MINSKKLDLGELCVRLNEHMKFDEIFAIYLWDIRYYRSTDYDHQNCKSYQGDLFQDLSDIQDDLSL